MEITQSFGMYWYSSSASIRMLLFFSRCQYNKKFQKIDSRGVCECLVNRSDDSYLETLLLCDLFVHPIGYYEHTVIVVFETLDFDICGLH